MLYFCWDQAKAESNLRKHRVTFALATRVFADPYALMDQDRIEGGERRWLTLGLVDNLLVLAVAHTVTDAQDGSETIRIIAARPADRRERKRYEQERSRQI
ncbi:BrnT family toxin [Methylobacterium sp. 77]|uniref:BrnT family toxin n=1 Tax=Methylobacterium sp. 77 TaxID=1101192 RepID=UPI00037D625C|nr:BrnT family toxin [Methylobacterium sp. 77]